jgi:glycosyltransferase involved in cell wall biosynthesis
VLLSVGRLVPKKGFDLLLGALALLRSRRPVELRIVGDGPDRGRLEELAGSLGLGESVRFAGPLGEAGVVEELDRCDAFVLASRPVAAPRGGIDQDGLPVVLMEAMARGALAVSTPVAGIPELVADGETGFLAEEPSAPAVAAAVERALACAEPDAVRARALERIRSDYLLERNVGRLAERMREVARA